ncbi:uncharacterized protein LOC110027025 [Phalaenopsis equestris]|uniref:uncharacterized protein LOC110027025 n=1 Tax=Phalaenopsis equestris TaxID=78828 RepID=UPI0009E28995|nr:uncharacterized protein LOC110027025 [Phalaenopsis equestris]
MDREKKRSDTGTSPVHDRAAKKGKLTVTAISELFSDDDDDFIQKPDSYRPLGVFEFPWQKDKGALALELDGCSFREVFYSSLVDGISPSRQSPITISGEADKSLPSDGDADGVDCIWSWALRQPLSALYCKSSGA